jgi:hypothetical protein
MKLPERVQALVESTRTFPWLGEISRHLLNDWVTREL